MKIFIVIPAYQAARTIAGVFARLPAVLAEKDLRIVVVDDGSTDGTAAVIRELMRTHDRTELIQHAHNRGYAQA